MKKIIVPVDFSDCSKNALNNAALIASLLHMELVVCHTLMVPTGFAEGVPASAVDIGLESMEKQAQTDIINLIEAVPLLKKIPHHFEVQYGTLSSHLEKLTNELDVALVVMGTHGAHGIQKMLFGSNAFHVMKHTKCPVIALPDESDLKKMKRFAFAIDCTVVPPHDVITMVVDLSKAFFGHLDLVHIDNNQVEHKRQIEVARNLDKYLKSVHHKFHFIQDGDVEHGLIDFVKRNNTDLLMMVAKHRSLLERLKHNSHTKRMMLEIPIPLMVFHE